MFLSLGFFAMIFLFGTLDFDTIFSIVPYMNSSTITIISLLLLLGAMAKSSQIFLHN
jgi:NADH-ubiquinone oxidoreductase chain 5